MAGFEGIGYSIIFCVLNTKDNKKMTRQHNGGFLWLLQFVKMFHPWSG